MAQVTGAFPYDLDNLLGGAARVLISDPSEAALPAIPANIKDVIDCVHPYAPVDGWLDIGATTDATSYTRDMDSEAYEIEQTNATIFEEITEVSRELEVEIGEVKPEHVKILEEGGTVSTIAAAAGAVAQKGVKFGSISSLTTYRVCFIGQRNRASGVVTETTGNRKRGRFVMLCLYACQIAADSSEVQVEKGELASLPVTFRATPEAGQTSGQEFGTWLFEDAGTIA